MSEIIKNETKRQQQTTTNVQEKAALIWNTADILRGLYKPHEYGKVILPMTVIKRLHDTLLPTREVVMKVAKENVAKVPQSVTNLIYSDSK
ncbi:type I restriction-modification system subunit M N-terminal domain-containing protein [Fructobacillus tropaeoli]|uniref:type I restriction-modification system subunit M N-terminal domain-containing protein n=1 Tax=Fructobacillus tropaeoli TaxID=709323 RepID=UPI002D96A259|nr:DNA methylase subunit (HsdM) [Fructobacillus tropaeoli]